jgi:hypothetical protein
MNMPANRRLKSHHKSFVGRTFTLRNVNLLPIYNDYKNNAIGSSIAREELGEAVFVLDESNTRACITKASGGLCWVPKYYLHKEIKSYTYHKYDSLTDVIVDLVSIKDSIKDEPNLKKLSDVITSLREMADEEYKTVMPDKK